MIFTPVYSILEYSVVKTLIVYAPAVSSSGAGVLSKITLGIAYPGSGRVFFSALPYTEIETQGAARVAAFIASLLARVEFSNYDYYVLVESTTPIIGGPSAGALFTIGFTSLLLGLSINNNTTMTGMINPDGTIGPVGGLKEKLEAAASSGFKVFLIPLGQRQYKYPVYEEITRGWLTIRRVTYRIVDLVEYGKKLNVSVIEVGNVLDALYYFTGVDLKRNTTEISIKINTELASILNNELTRVTSDTVKYIEKTTSIVNSLPSVYKYYYLQVLEDLNNTLTGIIDISRNYPTYVLFKLIDLYESILLFYLQLAIATGSLSVDNIIKSLYNVLDEYSKTAPSKCSLESSLARAHIYIAWYYYTKANSALNASNLDVALTNIARSYRNLLEYSIYKNISYLISEELSCEVNRLIHVYSNALASYVYVTKTLSSAGVTLTSNIASLLDDQVDVAAYMSENNDIGLLGISILILSYTSLLLHSAIGDTSSISGELEKIITIYMGASETPLYNLYIDIANGAREVRDRDMYSKALLSAVAVIQVLAQIHVLGRETSTSTQQNTLTPTTSTNNPLGISSPASNTTTSGSPNIASPLDKVNIYIDLLIVILAVTTLILLLTKLLSGSKKVFTS